jgi:hypothetical protein
MAVSQADRTWKWWDAGWRVRGASTRGGRMMAASLFNGIVVEPQNSVSAAAVSMDGTAKGGR